MCCALSSAQRQHLYSADELEFPGGRTDLVVICLRGCVGWDLLHER